MSALNSLRDLVASIMQGQTDLEQLTSQQWAELVPAAVEYLKPQLDQMVSGGYTLRGLVDLNYRDPDPNIVIYKDELDPKTQLVAGRSPMFAETWVRDAPRRFSEWVNWTRSYPVLGRDGELIVVESQRLVMKKFLTPNYDAVVGNAKPVTSVVVRLMRHEDILRANDADWGPKELRGKCWGICMLCMLYDSFNQLVIRRQAAIESMAFRTAALKQAGLVPYERPAEKTE